MIRTRNLTSTLIASAVFVFLASGGAYAADFSVNPIRLEIGPRARSGVITVKNEGLERMSFQLSAMAWSQSVVGADEYAETTDLIFFPRIMSVEGGQEGLVRVGFKNPVVPSEKTYRLFIEELPSLSENARAGGAQVNVLIRFGAAIFVAPARPQDALRVDGLALTHGKLAFSVTNLGNRHQVVQSIALKGADADGKEVFALTLADRYLLAGTVKPYTTSIGALQCERMVKLEVDVKTDRSVAKSNLDVSRAMCP